MRAVRDTIDFFRVDARHHAIHDRLENWARYVGSGRQAFVTMPMWRLYISGEWETPAEDAEIPIDILDGAELEKQVFQLPEKICEAVRWCYVYSRWGVPPWRAARVLGVQQTDLLVLIRNGRDMLKNRLTSR